MTLPAAPPLPASMRPASDDTAHRSPEDEPVDGPEPDPDDGAAEADSSDDCGVDADADGDGDGAGAVTVSVAAGCPSEAHPASVPTATSPVTTSRNFDRLLRCMVHRQPPNAASGSVGVQGPRAHSEASNPSSGGRT